MIFNPFRCRRHVLHHPSAMFQNSLGNNYTSGELFSASAPALFAAS